MGKLISDFVFRISARVNRASLNAAKQGVEDIDRAARGATRSSRTLSTALRGVAVSAVALGALRLTQGLVSTISEFQRLEAVLETVTGSQEEAARAMNFIEGLAMRLPFSVEQVSNAFIRLRGSGIAPTEQMMMNLGNVAGTFGSDLESLVTAAQNARRGMPRALEGILRTDIDARSSTTHLLVELEGQMHRVGRSTEEIVGFLAELGASRYAGGAERLMNTIPGALSNMMDSLKRFARKIGESGFADSLQRLLHSFGGFAGGATDLANILGTVLAGAIDVVNFALNTAVTLWPLVVGAIVLAIGPIGRIRGAWQALNAIQAASAAKVLLFISALGLLALAIQDVVYFQKGYRSLLGELIPEEHHENVRSIISSLGALLAAGLGAAGWFSRIREHGLEFGQWFYDFLHNNVASAWQSFLDFFHNAWIETINLIKEDLNQLPFFDLEIDRRTAQQRRADDPYRNEREFRRMIEWHPRMMGEDSEGARFATPSGMHPATFQVYVDEAVSRHRRSGLTGASLYAQSVTDVRRAAAEARQGVVGQYILNKETNISVSADHLEEAIRKAIGDSMDELFEQMDAELPPEGGITPDVGVQ